MSTAVAVEAQAERPKPKERADALIAQVVAGTVLPLEDAVWLGDYVLRAERRARKANEQRVILRGLNKAYRMLRLELVWMRAVFFSGAGKGTQSSDDRIEQGMRVSKNTLWNQFKREESLGRRNDRLKVGVFEKQIDKLAAAIVDNVPGEPSRSEGAVDTAIRLLKAYAKLGTPEQCSTALDKAQEAFRSQQKKIDELEVDVHRLRRRCR